MLFYTGAFIKTVHFTELLRELKQKERENIKDSELSSLQFFKSYVANALGDYITDDPFKHSNEWLKPHNAPEITTANIPTPETRWLLVYERTVKKIVWQLIIISILQYSKKSSLKTVGPPYRTYK